jgi:3-oxoacyl-[acyl-carrier-protein] synthase III
MPAPGYRTVTGMSSAVVAGLGAWLPPRVVRNEDLSSRLDTSDEWIRRRTGIAQRRVAEPGMSTADLATEAGFCALKSAGSTDVDVVVLATTTPDRLCPSTAPEVAARLGLSGVGAYDLSAVCSGFVYGLATCCGLISAGIARRILLIAAETYSTIIDPADRGTAVIFGDGAGAMLLRAGDREEPGAIGPFDLGSDGELSDLIAIAAGGSARAAGSSRPGTIT